MIEHISFDAFKLHYRQLTLSYRRPDNEDQAAAYWEVLKHVDAVTLEHTIRRVVATEKFFPTPAVLLAAVATGPRPTQADTSREVCETCGGSGFVDAPDESHHGVVYRGYVTKCPTCRPPVTAHAPPPPRATLAKPTVPHITDDPNYQGVMDTWRHAAKLPPRVDMARSPTTDEDEDA